MIFVIVTVFIAMICIAIAGLLYKPVNKLVDKLLGIGKYTKSGTNKNVPHDTTNIVKD